MNERRKTMAQPFNCATCGTLRPSNANFCKKCGRPFTAQRVSPITRSKNLTQKITAPAPVPATPANIARRQKKPGAGSAQWQKVFISIIWTVVTIALAWFTLQRSTQVKVDNVPYIEPEPVASSTAAMPPERGKGLSHGSKGQGRQSARYIRYHAALKAVRMGFR